MTKTIILTLIALLCILPPFEVSIILAVVVGAILLKTKISKLGLFLSIFVIISAKFALGYINQNSINGRCFIHVGTIADKICEHRHKTGEWPNQAMLHEVGVLGSNEKLETLKGVPIIYNPETGEFNSKCVHEDIPFLGWIKSTGYYSECSGHGTDLKARYEHLYN